MVVFVLKRYVRKQEVEHLLELKTNTSEMGESAPINIINQYIEEKVIYFENFVKNISNNKQNDWETLNEIFLMNL